MENKKKLRRLNHLMGRFYIHVDTFSTWKKQTIESAEYRKKYKWVNKQQDGHIAIYKLAEELEISDNELKLMWFEKWTQVYKLKLEYQKKPQKEGRDNKDVYVGSGFGNSNNPIRYPSKKRSIKTWKNFYKLFPYAAVVDGWDGKTSNRMK